MVFCSYRVVCPPPPHPIHSFSYSGNFLKFGMLLISFPNMPVLVILPGHVCPLSTLELGASLYHPLVLLIHLCEVTKCMYCPTSQGLTDLNDPSLLDTSPNLCCVSLMAASNHLLRTIPYFLFFLPSFTNGLFIHIAPTHGCYPFGDGLVKFRVLFSLYIFMYA